MKRFIPLLLLVLLTGCSTYSSSKFIRDGSYETIFDDKVISPSEVIISEDNIKNKYIVMGKIEVTVNKTTAFHPDPTKEIVNAVLQEKAADIGADAVIEVIYIGPRISFASWGTMEGIGTAVKYTNVRTEDRAETDKDSNQFLSFDDAVAQCKELGLKSGTDKFTDCVNKLNGRN